MTVQVMNLSKAFGHHKAVDDLSFTVEPGIVTGFLGPNGAGKSTTMRLMLGLDRGEGITLWDGLKLNKTPNAASVVGAHLDAKTFVPNRTARKHLRMLAAASGVSNQRVDEVIELMGLGGVANKRPKGFSLGMAQRLGLAAAILAKPRVLLLDEPANGLDPMSIQWLREFLRNYAEQDRSVLVSSHLLNEMQLMADHVVVISRGRLIANESTPEFVARSTRNDVLLKTPDLDRMIDALAATGISSTREGETGLAVMGAQAMQVGEIAFANNVRLWELATRTASLEQAFLELTASDQEFALGAEDVVAVSALSLDSQARGGMPPAMPVAVEEAVTVDVDSSTAAPTDSSASEPGDSTEISTAGTNVSPADTSIATAPSSGELPTLEPDPNNPFNDREERF